MARSPQPPRAASGSEYGGVLPSSATRRNNQCLVIRNSRAMLGGLPSSPPAHSHTHTRSGAHISHGGTSVSEGICRLMANYMPVSAGAGRRQAGARRAQLRSPRTWPQTCPWLRGLFVAVDARKTVQRSALPRSRRGSRCRCSRLARPGRAGPGGGGAAAAPPERALAPPSGLAAEPLGPRRWVGALGAELCCEAGAGCGEKGAAEAGTRLVFLGSGPAF